MRSVCFELNGIRRDVKVPDEAAQKHIVKVPMADPEDKSQVGASIPGAVSKIAVKVGDTVEKNQTLLTIEAMKMETAVTARMGGKIASIEIKEGDAVKGGQLLLTVQCPGLLFFNMYQNTACFSGMRGNTLCFVRGNAIEYLAIT